MSAIGACETEPETSTKRLSSESLYLEIAALRAFYRFAENEKLLPSNLAENLSLPRRWKRLPKALSGEEIERLLTPEQPETPQSLCDQAVLELAYASGLRLAELRNVRLEQLHLEAGFINVDRQGQQGAGGAARPESHGGDESLPGGGAAETGDAEIARSGVSDATGHAVCRGDDVAADQAARAPGRDQPERDARTCCGIALPRTCWRTAPICGSSRNCWGTPASAPRKFTRMWRRPAAG